MEFNVILGNAKREPERTETFPTFESAFAFWYEEHGKYATHRMSITVGSQCFYLDEIHEVKS